MVTATALSADLSRIVDRTGGGDGEGVEEGGRG